MFRYDVLPVTPAWQSDSVLNILQASYPSIPTIGLIPNTGKKFIYSPKRPDQFWDWPSLLFYCSGGCSSEGEEAGIWIWPRILPSAEDQQFMELCLLSPYIIIACPGTALILLRGGARGAPIQAPPLFCKNI